MFTAKEIGEKIETQLTDPKYKEILQFDDEMVKKKRDEKRKR